MIYWFTINLFILLSIRIFSIRKYGWPRRFYPYICSICFLTLAYPASNGGSVTYHADPIDDLLSLGDDALLEEIQRATFRYFWDFAHPASGMVRERNTSGDLVTSGGSGFGIMAIIVGIHREFITREEGIERLQLVIQFLGTADRFHGAWSHWMNGNTGKVIPFSTKDNGGDLVETAFLLQGLLTARSYFDRETPEETQLRSDITSLWEGVEWNWYRKQVNQVLFWHWSPTFGFDLNLPVQGWNETMIAYILGIASPSHPLPAGMYEKGWAGSEYQNGKTFYGYKLEVGNDTGGPLFFTHYSFLGFDPRNKRDAFANYFFQGQNQTLINRAWCIENPKGYEGYGPDCWGLTASDDPHGYHAHAPNHSADNGTITPSAALSSIVYTPVESLAAARHFLSMYREKVWGPMGFYDAFNPSENWFSTSFLAIDQGPIICMIENYRSGLLWDYFMRNEEITGAMEKIGFTEDSSLTGIDEPGLNIKIFPNPSEGLVCIELPDKTINDVFLTDLEGKNIPLSSTINNNQTWVNLGLNRVPGIYYLTIIAGKAILTEKILLRNH